MRERIVGFLIVAMIITMGLAGYSFAKTETESAKLGQQVHVVCSEHKLLAVIAKQKQEEQIESSKLILPKINFPGLTHAQLVQLTHAKEVKESAQLGKLEAIAQETC